MAKLKITQVRSSIRSLPGQKKVLAALGLRGVGKVVEQTTGASLDGMLHKVLHLVKVEELK